MPSRSAPGLSPARLVLPAVRWKAGSGFAEAREALGRALDLGVGGYIVFGGTAKAVHDLTTWARERAGRPLLVGADLERGAGQQIEGLTDFPPPAALATLDLDAIGAAARVTAREARSVGINLVFAPVADLDVLADNPIVQTRSFGADPVRVAEAVAAWVRGCQDNGALACVKHYPGHGRTAADSHRELPVVAAGQETLSSDELPFRGAIEAGVAAVMTAHVAFPALDPTGTPATFSAPIISRLKHQLGHGGLVVTDALIMEAARRKDETSAALEILEAGVDLLLYPRDPVKAAEALIAAEAGGRIAPDRLAAALHCYSAALQRLEGMTPAAPESAAGEAQRQADRLLARGVVRGSRPSLRSPVALTIIDDDTGGPYAPSPDVMLRSQLRDVGVALGTGGSRVVAVFNEPRGWKGRAGFSPEARARLDQFVPGADLVVLFGHPRLVEAIPGDAPVLVAWHRQRLMQEGAVRALKDLVIE